MAVNILEHPRPPVESDMGVALFLRRISFNDGRGEATVPGNSRSDRCHCWREWCQVLALKDEDKIDEIVKIAIFWFGLLKLCSYI
jgi:hypothetical protein